ncbi:redoxin domain-containing protein [Streptosporangium sp. NPDC020145]|uniref:redoxin domain-containing protein n=1 Tax=Streptosporangium sp. NPDC020145 TaxID=3154694 RepID=UPI00343AE3D3
MCRLRFAAALAAAAAVLLACGTTPSGSTGQEPAGKLAFTATTVDGAAFQGTTLQGKDAVLWFWAPWCGECRREAPNVAAVQASAGGKAVFVGVAGLGEVADMKGFVAEFTLNAFPHLADVTGEIWKRFGIVRQPAYAFIDDDGTVEVVRGELGQEALAAKVADLTGS